ncbi:major facilitator superfamily transporter MFS_1 [Thecamonas trahens ATCC 50062]|uniref:Major facilitator superfamily transporter MFS_1 n=1 Tax=Thecamonas trahens ATCC 50062 TaxID=461836 RepID=A0A0L0DGE5_THETB|nr:major facilitator superfamily transporter MFS_1 [Thecamonas trahens ATCC 50062]KNC51404.1 major facilitator superfamily transporter MFS_1 [Thecamonas trahens ATCC 50062]|eukprot:XP_013756071.1 major facilitator superfamily transporter MFS_1 [Thecamonas trahens ATCC 50062]
MGWVGRVWRASGEFLAANGRRFLPLVLGLVAMGAVLGLERSLLPLMASSVWGQDSYKAKTMFIVSFGLAKALMNVVSGQLADRFGRKLTLVIGFVFGLPVPLVILFTNSWDLVVAVNVLFGMSQGLIGSSLIFMVIDLFGVERKGLAVGICEALIYSTVSVMSAVASEIADKHGYRPVPFIIGAVVGGLGLLSSAFVIDTMDLVRAQQANTAGNAAASDALLLESGAKVEPVTYGGVDNGDAAALDDVLAGESRLPSRSATEAIIRLATNPNFVLVALAGLMDKCKDSILWGLAPEFLEENHNVSIATTGIVLALYPAVWGGTQLFLGGATDRLGRRLFLALGFATNAIALGAFVLIPMIHISYSERIILWSLCAVLLGFGTAAVYPTMQAAAADEVEPAWRASSLGIYRCVRDFGYAVGALSAGGVADAFGLDWSIGGLASLLFLLALALAIFYRNRL